MKPVKHPKCVRCDKKPGRLPPDKPLFCSLACIYVQMEENHMDWVPCAVCGQWRDMRYECRNDNCETNQPKTEEV